ncbi:MAG: hypothetical protein U1E47_08070 [Rivihabitans pingtungensis]
MADARAATGSCANNCAPVMCCTWPRAARQDIRRRLDADDPPPASHALLWLGEVGQAPAGVPWSAIATPPIGCATHLWQFYSVRVQLRPFYDAAPGSDLPLLPAGAQSAYFEQLLWASRLLPDVVERVGGDCRGVAGSGDVCRLSERRQHRQKHAVGKR